MPKPGGEAALPLSDPGAEIQSYIRRPPERRKPVGYDRAFLETYRPNETFYLSAAERKHLLEVGRPKIAEQPAGPFWMRKMREIQLKDAKAKLSAVIDQAVRGNPAIITRHGRREAVVLSFDQYEKLLHVPSFGRLLASFPGDEGDIPLRSNKSSRTVNI